MHTLLSVLIILLISIVLSAFFSGMEIAYISVDQLRFKVEGTQGLTNRIVNLFIKRPSDFISTMLVGNNVALIVYGIMMAQLIEKAIPTLTQNELALLIVETVISTLIILFLGEFIPKTLFKLHPHSMLRFFALPLLLFYIILYPIQKIASGLSFLFLRLFGVKVTREVSVTAFSKVDLDHFVQKGIDEAEQADSIENEVKIFQNALDFSTVRLRDCMVPRTEIIAVETTDPLETLLSHFTESGVSKLIVFEGTIDNIVGYIHSSEMFRQPKDWRNHITKIPIVPETMQAHKLMTLFMQQKRTLAVVVDEFGGTSGIVSLEDLVEEIFGEIEDEHDSTSYICKEMPDGTFLISARMEIDAVNETLGIHLPESDEYLTIGGYILSKNQSFPTLNEVVEIHPYEFKILKVASTKIELVRLKIKE